MAWQPPVTQSFRVRERLLMGGAHCSIRAGT
jgi:hypothetical protein